MPEKKLTLSTTDKKIAGVCGGIAEHLDLDPSIVRIVWLCFTLLGGAGLLFYLITWLVLSATK